MRVCGAPEPEPPRVRLTNVADAPGLRFVYQHSPTADKVLRRKRARAASRCSTTTATAGPTSSSPTARRRRRSKRRAPIYSNRLYRNDGGMRFTDVTNAAGVSRRGYAIGAAAGDFDNDGHVDLFVAGVARQPAASQSRRRAIRGRHEGRGHRQRRVRRRRRLVRLRQRRPARSPRRQLRAVVGRQEPVLRRRGPRESASIAIRASSRDCRTASTAIAATARSRTSRREPACRRTSARA